MQYVYAIAQQLNGQHSIQSPHKHKREPRVQHTGRWHFGHNLFDLREHITPPPSVVLGNRFAADNVRGGGGGNGLKFWHLVLNFSQPPSCNSLRALTSSSKTFAVSSPPSSSNPRWRYCLRLLGVGGWGLGFGVWGLGFVVCGLGIGDLGLRIEV